MPTRDSSFELEFRAIARAIVELKLEVKFWVTSGPGSGFGTDRFSSEFGYLRHNAQPHSDGSVYEDRWGSPSAEIYITKRDREIKTSLD
jgi:hypothetical protein